MPQGGRQPHSKQQKNKQQPGVTACDSGAAAPATTQKWQRGSGGFSGKAKSDYLKWKRQQKAARTDELSSDEEQHKQQQVHSRPPRTKNGQPPAASSRRPGDAAQPLHYSPLVAVPAAAFSMAAPVQDSGVAAGGVLVQGSGNDDSAHNNSSSTITTYMPRLDPAHVGFTPEGWTLGMPTRPAWQGVVSTAEQLHALEETQFAAWQADLSLKAQQLQQATEPAAAAVQDASCGAGTTLQQQLPPLPQQQQLPHKQTQQQQQQQEDQPAAPPQLTQGGLAAGIGSISPYEGRLEFWRQLWRTLEMSDVVCMIVDARNPVLHFSHALYRHITQDHKLPLLLLLNKCDLIPAAAATAWQQWLQQQLLGAITVIPVSAAKENAGATARAVLTALLQLQVQREGGSSSDSSCQVQDLVGLDLDALIEESLLRNTHAKRHLDSLLLYQQHQQQQCGGQQATEATAAAAGAIAAAAAAGEEAGESLQEAAAAASAAGDDTDEEDVDWSLSHKPRHNRAASRKSRRRAAGRSHSEKQQQQQQLLLLTPAATSSDAAAETVSETDADDDDAAAAAAEESPVQSDDGVKGVGGPAAVPAAGADDDDLLSSLTLERRLSSSNTPAAAHRGGDGSFSSSSRDSRGVHVDGCVTTAAAGGVAAAGVDAGEREGVGAAGLSCVSDRHEEGKQPDDSNRNRSSSRKRPVVVGMLGEPNVGKSSVLNALLGSHRVAVSSHPGRTKHYQTHYMCDNLVLVDCPGIVFPRLNVSPAMQVLFGSSPIASCRQPYDVVRYLAESSWPRVQDTLRLQPQLHTLLNDQQQQQQELPEQKQQQQLGGVDTASDSAAAAAEAAEAADAEAAAVLAPSGGVDKDGLSPWTLCEALALKRHFTLPRSGRLDTYRAANYLLRTALAGQHGVRLAFLPPPVDAAAETCSRFVAEDAATTGKDAAAACHSV